MNNQVVTQDATEVSVLPLPPFEICVNEKPVTVSRHLLTGHQIKQAAIDAGVRIQLDFVLSMEIGPRRVKVIQDEQQVPIGQHSRFIAVAPDDNS